MAIARGAGTEIIRTHLFNALGAVAARTIILGVQHHIYTVLSVTAYCVARNSSEYGYLNVIGYDVGGGLTAQTKQIARLSNSVGETFVWNDKFSFNGFEPTDFTAAIDATKQDAVADQGSSVPQYLHFSTDGTSTYYDVTVTFLDQNNA
jgi:hypothetical protein